MYLPFTYEEGVIPKWVTLNKAQANFVYLEITCNKTTTFKYKSVHLRDYVFALS